MTKKCIFKKRLKILSNLNIKIFKIKFFIHKGNQWDDISYKKIILDIHSLIS